MKFSIRDIALVVVILGAGLAFWHHSRSVRNEIHDFKIHTGHQLAKNAFEAKFDVVDENFRRANFTFLPNRKDLVVLCLSHQGHSTGSMSGRLTSKSRCVVESSLN